jgi:uncharacterized protein YdeI (BOF family)
MYRCVVLLALCALCGGLLCDELVPPPRATAAVPAIPLSSLRSTSPQKEPVWIRVTIVEQTDDDTYLVQDVTGQITLFLSVDSLLSLELKPGMEILVYGTLDISPVSSSKNEFYAERILLPPLLNAHNQR